MMSPHHACDHNHEHPKLTDERTNIPANAQIFRLTLTAMDCPTEAELIRRAFANNPHIHLLEFDFIHRILSVTHTLEDQQQIQRTLINIGILEDPTRTVHHSARKEWVLFALSGILAISSEILSWIGADLIFIATAAFCAVLCVGPSIIKKGWLAIRHLRLTIYFLMSVAVIGAMLLGQFPEAAMVIFLFTLAEKIEAASLDRARHAISALQRHVAESAQVLQDNGDWITISSNKVQLGQTLRVRPGEQIALDGVVTAGYSSINQAPITGESIPVNKSIGDSLFAGSLNEEGVLEYQVTAIRGSTTLDRIAAAIQQAQQHRAPAEDMIDAFARIYTPCIFGLAILVAVVLPLLFNMNWHESIYKALVLLVVACPCALVISTPVTVVSALTSAARRGILIKGGRYLEIARHLTTIAFDKTGTLTIGKIQLNDIFAVAHIDEATCLQIAASLNHLSQHPIAGAIVSAYKGQLKNVDDFYSSTGRGVSGKIEGESYVLGNLRLMKESFITLPPPLHHQIQQLELTGNTVAILAHVQTQKVVALFSVADNVRHDSQSTIAQLNNMNIRTVMLTGDNRHTAQAIAQQVGIDEVHAELLPEDKLNLIANLQQQGRIAMLGDGVNDAPALARADLGITLGAAGSATALEVADIALMQDDLSKIPELIYLSRRCATILIQNISIALGLKAAFLLFTLLGETNLWMAVFADMGASLLVIFNGLRLLSKSDIKKS
ncbi:MAG: cadA [Solimicrobium sp.]|jgi:Cd2+/Zn2+-exporting ATPase|nr:cadA [Solimicrobium sp.]